MNNTTRRFPRTLTQAFGAHTSQSVDEEYPAMDAVDKLVLSACAIAFAFVIAIMMLT